MATDSLGYLAKNAEIIVKFMLAPLLGTMFYIWNRHVKSNDKKFETVEERVENQKRRMDDFGIKITDEVVDVWKRLEYYKEKTSKENREDKTDLMSAIKENGSKISTFVESFNDHKLNTEKRLTRIETIIKE